MTKHVRRGAILIVCAAVAFWATQSTGATTKPLARFGGGSFQIETSAGKGGVQRAPGGTTAYVPPNCSNWHELFPTWCNYHHQSGYKDNADGVMSACDSIAFDGGPYQHIDWVGPTYFFDVVTDTVTWRVVFEPSGSHDPGNPVCEYWHVIYVGMIVDPPADLGLEYCDIVHIDGWDDVDDSGGLSEGDTITIVTTTYVLRHIGVDIITSPSINADIPTLNEWGVLALALIVMALGLFVMSRRSRTRTA